MGARGRWLLSASLWASACAQPHAAAPRVPEELSALLPTRLRLLSNIELQNSAVAVLGTGQGLAERLPPDVRQQGYTRNAAQVWSASRAVRWAKLVDEAVEAATQTGLAALWPCTAKATPQCRDVALANAALRAWRRPASQTELDALGRVYDDNPSAPIRERVAAVYSALLQAPSFVYLTELGDPAAGKTTGPASVPNEKFGTKEADATSNEKELFRYELSVQDTRRTELTGYEIASQLSYTLQAAPPDRQLLDLAARGQLRSPQVRRAEAWRILSKSETRYQFRRFVLEWLEVDRLNDTAKDPEQYPAYEGLKAKMLAETANYTDEVWVHHGASVSALLDAGFTSVEPSMARYYGLNAFGPSVPLAGTARHGILQQASVLAAHAHPDVSSPVKRGDFILRRILCVQLPRPAELGIEVVMPVAVADQSGRARISAHGQNPGCASCHRQIDPLGFAFENFDAAGGERRVDGGRPTDTQVDWTYAAHSEHFGDSLELSHWLSQRPETHSCFQRQAFRYFSGQAAAAPEAAFVSLAARLAADERQNLVSLLVEYIASDLFVQRRSPS